MPGIHHVTAIASDPLKNFDFYMRDLGLRFVKKTVNFDDPSTYHFYYGDEIGSPGTILTFFPWAGAPAGRRGVGETHQAAFRVPLRSLRYWTQRFIEKGIPHEALEKRFGESVLPFTDPDGMALALVGVAHVAFTGDLAEIGVSVLPGHRGSGIGSALLARAADHVRNRFVTRLFMHCLAENATMLHIARKLGMKICVNTGEADAFLKLSPADPASVAGEFVDQRLALFDYALKAQAMQFKRIADDQGAREPER